MFSGALLRDCGAKGAILRSAENLAGPPGCTLTRSAGAILKSLVDTSTGMCDLSLVDLGMRVWLGAAALQTALLINDFTAPVQTSKRNV